MLLKKFYVPVILRSNREKVISHLHNISKKPEHVTIVLEMN